MKPLRSSASRLLALVVLAGCASTEISERNPYQGEQLVRPGRIIIHDFTGEPAEIPAESPFAEQMTETVAPTPEQRELGQKLGGLIAQKLVANLNGMGLPAVVAAGQPSPQVNDVVLRGYFTSIDEGSAEKRVIVGFGAGAAEMGAAVEGYQMTADGLRLLGSGEVQSEGADMPGLVAPLAIVAATANPIGLVVGGAAHAYGEASGADTIEGAAERIANEISDQLQKQAEKQGWV